MISPPVLKPVIAKNLATKRSFRRECPLTAQLYAATRGSLSRLRKVTGVEQALFYRFAGSTLRLQTAWRRWSVSHAPKRKSHAKWLKTIWR